MAQTEYDKEILNHLEKFHKFYSDAWDKLIKVIVFGFLVVGIIVPAFALLFQWRSFKNEADSVKQDIRVEQEEVFAELQYQLEEYIEDCTVSAVQSVGGGVLHVQALLLLSDKHYYDAAQSCVGAARTYHASHDEGNLQSMLQTLAATCLPELRKEDFEVHGGLATQLKELLSDLSEDNTDGRYSNYIDAIRVELKKAKER